MGNRQAKGQDKVEQITPQVVNISPVVQIVPLDTINQSSNQNNLKQGIESLTQAILGIGPWIQRQKTEISQSQVASNYRSCCAAFNSEVRTPLCELYSILPNKITEGKFELISSYNFNQRFTALNILSALTAMESVILSKGNPVKRLLRTTRNVSFVYVIGGLLIAPQIYNPLIRDQ